MAHPSGMDYRSALPFLLSLSDWERVPPGQQTSEAARFKLERMRSLLARLDNPQLGRSTIHIAGTKGKGSVAAMIASVVRAASERAGLSTGPHLHRMPE